MNINDYKSKDGDVTGAGYEFVGNQRQGAGDIKTYAKKKIMREKKYLDFVLNPDTEEPVRMPSDYTFPTNIVSVCTDEYLNIGSLSSFAGFFAPQNQLACTTYYANLAPFFSDESAVFPSYVFISKKSGGVGYDGFQYTDLVFANADVEDRFQSANRFPYFAQFDTARCIGAVCEITYIGALENTSGVIHISANIVPAISYGIGRSKCPSVSQMNNMLIYKKYRVSQTTRSLWFPVDFSAQYFQNANPANNPSSVSALINYSQLVFYFRGVSLPQGSKFNFKFKMYYEVVPNLKFSTLFASTQGVSDEEKKSAWSKILQIAKNELDDFLITGIDRLKM